MFASFGSNKTCIEIGHLYRHWWAPLGIDNIRQAEQILPHLWRRIDRAELWSPSKELLSLSASTTWMSPIGQSQNTRNWSLHMIHQSSRHQNRFYSGPRQRDNSGFSGTVRFMTQASKLKCAENTDQYLPFDPHHPLEHMLLGYQSLYVTQPLLRSHAARP